MVKTFLEYPETRLARQNSRNGNKHVKNRTAGYNFILVLKMDFHQVNDLIVFIAHSMNVSIYLIHHKHEL